MPTRFDSFNSFLKRRCRLLIVGWIIIVLISLTLIPSFFSAVSYNITNTSLGGSSNSESQQAQKILETEFPQSNNSTNGDIIIVLESPQVLSNQVRRSFLSLNRTFSLDRNIKNFTGMSSLYTTESSLLSSTLSSGLYEQLKEFASNITSLNTELYVLGSNISSLNSNIFLLFSRINQTAQLLYGIPSQFVSLWSNIVSGGQTNPTIADEQANATIYTETASFGGNEMEISYYSLFFKSWNSSFQNYPSLNMPQALAREQLAVNETVPQFIASNPSFNSTTKQLFDTTTSGLNVTTWNSRNSMGNLTLNTLAPQIPSNLTSSLHVASQQLLLSLYELGRTPSNSTISGLSISLVEAAFSGGYGIPGLSVNEVVNKTFALGPSPSVAAAWSLASSFIANATSSSFSASPLFSVNSTSLYVLLDQLSNSSEAVVSSKVASFVNSLSVADYPFLISRDIAKNFVSSDNQTMIVIYNFSFSPDSRSIDAVRTDVASSNLSSYGTVYVTGGSVIDQDVSNVFGPAVGITLIPGVLVSILIVGLLFLSPVAALIPLMLGGISIAVALPAIYFGVVILGHGTITFLTPTLTILLMLGLAVDYSVLQLRRTREERLSGHTKEESIATSVRWAGEAVITAGITVIVAYVVMAAAKVPIFSDVGVAIALGVSILLLSSMTLLPSVELALGDRLFWPNLRSRNTRTSSRLKRISENTLKRKVLVVSVIGVMAIGAFYLTHVTPTGVDLLKLIPNFNSNQGLTVISNALGSSTISPSLILITTPTPIVAGNDQFNDTILNQIELISSTAAASSGVASVTGPSRPFGSPFDYSSLSNMSTPVREQYLNAMLSEIGKDNKTALVSVGLTSSSQSAAAVSSLSGIESKISDLSLMKGITVTYGGATQSASDSEAFMNGLLPEVIVILAAAVYFILLAQLRSAFTPVRLVITILCSVAFALSLLEIAFYYAQKLPIFDFAPLFVVVTMLGVGIDYDIFFVTRIREEVLSGKNDNEAIETAVSKVWVTILGLGLILASVFGSLLVTRIGMLQEISLSVASAIMIDVTVVILFFVPSLMGLAQRFNWWPSNQIRNREEKSSRRG